MGIMKHMGTVAKIVAANMGVEIIIDPYADTASTDGEKIYLPEKFIGNGDERAALLMRGFIAHEGVGHIRHTDMMAWNDFVEHAPPLGRSVLNIIEDIRIERLASLVYPGIRHILHDTVEVLKTEGFFDMPVQLHPAGVVTGLFLNCLRAEELGQPVDTVPAKAIASQLFGMPLRDELLELARIGSRGNSTADAVNATVEILKRLSEEAKKSPSEKLRQKRGGNPSTKASDNKSAQALAADEKQCGDKSLEGMAQQAMGGTGRGAGNNLTEIDRSVIREPVAGWRPSARSAGISRCLSRKLEDLLQSRVDDEDCPVKGGGRLDSKRIVRSRLLDLQVFEVEGEDSPGLDTAVFVLVDKSGSMASPMPGGSGDSRAVVALDTLSALGDALGRFDGRGVSFAIEGFSSTMTAYKPFDANWRGARACLGRYVSAGGTDFISAFHKAIGEIAKRKERRRVILVITDGDVGDHALAASIRSTAAEHGIESRVVFLGEDPSVVDAQVRAVQFERYGLANRAEDVPKAIFEALADVF